MKKYCKCGCGKEIEIKPHHKYHGIPDFINGHNTKINNPMNNEESRKKVSESQIGKKLSEETKEKMRGPRPNFCGETNHFFGKHHTKEARRKISESRKDEKHPDWKGGCDAYWHRKAGKLFKKNYCEKCKKEENLDLHNKLKPKDYTVMKAYAWETLCKSCHKLEELYG